MLRERYGAGPLHLIAAIAMTAICGYGFLRIFGSPKPVSVLIWLGGAIVLHDMLAFPLYTALSRLAFGRAGQSDRPAVVAATTYLRVAIFGSVLLFVVWIPEILQRNDRYPGASGLSQSGFLERWLLLSAAIFAVSGLLYALRIRRAQAHD